MGVKDELSDFVNDHLFNLAEHGSYRVHPAPLLDSFFEAFENNSRLGVELCDRKGKADFTFDSSKERVPYYYDELAGSPGSEFPGASTTELLGILNYVLGSFGSSPRGGVPKKERQSLSNELMNDFSYNLKNYFSEYHDKMLVPYSGKLSSLEGKSLFDEIFETKFLHEVYIEVVTNEAHGIVPKEIPHPEELNYEDIRSELEPYSFFPTREVVFENFLWEYMEALYDKGFSLYSPGEEEGRFIQDSASGFEDYGN